MRPTFNVRQEYLGTGSVSSYQFSFKITALEQLLLVALDDDGDEHFRVRGTDTVHIDSVTFDPLDGGGTVVLKVNLPADYRLFIMYADDEPVQTHRYRLGRDTKPRNIEDSLDYLMGAIQRLMWWNKRALKIGDVVRDTDADVIVGDFPKPTVMGAILRLNDTNTGYDYGPNVQTIASDKAAAEAAAIAAAASAGAALSSENNAAASANTASGHADDAEAARDLALQYRNEAEGFKDDAEAAALSAVTTIGPVGSTPNANGGTIATNTLTLQPASSSHPGVMTTGTQTIAGSKAWIGRQLFTDLVDMGADASNVTQTGDDQTIPAEQMTRVVLRTTAATLNSIAGFNGTDVDWLRFHIFFNASSTDKVLRNQSGSASATHRIITGTGADVTVAPGASVLLVRDVDSSRWRVVGGAGGGSSTVFGSLGSPRSVVAATGITAGAAHMSASVTDQIVFVQGSISGESDVSANPQIQAHSIVGSKMRLYGVSDADFIKLETGTGLLLNGDWYSYAGAVLDLMWNGSVWAETGRNR